MPSEKELNSFPVRFIKQTGWQVLVVPEDKWLDCKDESDARLIAKAPILERDALTGIRSGENFACELDSLSKALKQYRIGFGARFFHRFAEIARNSKQ